MKANEGTYNQQIRNAKWKTKTREKKSIKKIINSLKRRISQFLFIFQVVYLKNM